MRSLRRLRCATVVPVAVVALLAGCGGDGDGDTGARDRSPGAGEGSRGASVQGTVTVFAAASLQEAFTGIGKDFEAAHPGVEVVFSFGPSSALAEQVAQGAPADVFASASGSTMGDLVSSGDASAPTDFVSNTMEIAVPSDNPAGVRAVADLAAPGVKVALCQAQVPCGATARKVFDNAGVKVTPVTEEADVKATLSKVRLGEVDAGVVYVTDVGAAGHDVRGIEIPDDVNAATTYPIAALSDPPNPAAAKAFVAYVLSAEGAATLTAAGFSRP